MPNAVEERVVNLVNHPLAQHKLTQLRMRETESSEFRRVAQELSMLLAYEITRDMETAEIRIQTPLESMMSPVLAGRRPCIVSILRAGNGILEGLLWLMPTARVGFVGLYRNEETLEPVEYYFKVPPLLEERRVMIVDPMLATGRTATAAATRLKQAGARDLRFLCIVAAPEGIETFHDTHPDVPITTAAIDEYLNADGFIVPGLGDAGDRLFGTE